LPVLIVLRLLTISYAELQNKRILRASYSVISW